MLQEQCQPIIIVLRLKSTNFTVLFIFIVKKIIIIICIIIIIMLIPYIIIEARPSTYLPSIIYIKGIMEEYKVKNYSNLRILLSTILFPTILVYIILSV